MSFREPGKIEIGLTNFFTYRLFAPQAKKYVNSLDLSGAEKVLDYGSGNGAVTRFLARRVQCSGSDNESGGEVVCVDISREWQRVIRKKLQKYTNIRYFHGTLGEFTASGNERGSFDAVFIHYMLHDIPKEERQGKLVLLSELLKSGGRLFIKEPVKIAHGIPADEIRMMCMKAGFTEVEGDAGKKDFQGVFVQQ